ncbi:hypothetical protein T265_11929 [Opisthorchis viverrini]|uniref:Uncharacterized protein n=1 Tax=Opisthorchis viverrini TaxID=6198 RepID=A0A074Z185_OPIVI|nr:hypothetical protein T265_11929 [Opisthorchis viverrini]KER19232.1 hypothetical protein T265_11929 [Opisthorchis viverrini]
MDKFIHVLGPIPKPGTPRRDDHEETELSGSPPHRFTYCECDAKEREVQKPLPAKSAAMITVVFLDGDPERAISMVRDIVRHGASNAQLPNLTPPPNHR